MVRSAIIAGTLMAISTSSVAARTVPPVAAVVRGHAVSHAPSGLTIRVPKSATFVGKERFDLKGVADGEIEVFVEADAKKRLSKLYWVQFEHPWPDQTWRYDYTTDRRDHRWGTTVWVRTIPYQTSDTPEPRSDVEHVRKMLARAGYTPPPQMTFVRIIQLPDDPKGTGHGGREVMFIYGEAGAKSGRALEQRALKAFEVARR